MPINTETLITINNLVLTNNDRMSGYRQVINLLSKHKTATESNADLLAFFSTYLNDSQAFSNQLTSLLGKEVYMPENASDYKNSVHAWASTGATLSANRDAILRCCHKGEEQAAKVYDYALSEDQLSADAKNILMRQKNEVVRAQKILEALMNRTITKAAA